MSSNEIMPCCANCKHGERRDEYSELMNCQHPNKIFNGGMLVNQMDCCDNFEARQVDHDDAA